MAESPQALTVNQALIPPMSTPSQLANGYPTDLTPTEQRILNLLKDGRPHWRSELHALLSDELAGPKALGFHLATLRKRVVKHGKMIVCVHPSVEDYSKIGYQLVRFQ